VKLELIRFLGTVPLAQMNLRSPMRGEVTVSDASEYGGGFCVSNGLTAMGVHAASCLVRGDVPEPDDFVQALSIGLFDGIGSLRVACDVLKLPMGGHISSEVCCEGSKLLESHFPDSEQVGNVEHIDEEMVIGWAAKYSNVGVVVVGGGPPCLGVSGLNADRKGALRDARSSLFIHVRRVFNGDTFAGHKFIFLWSRCSPWMRRTCGSVMTEYIWVWFPMSLMLGGSPCAVGLGCTGSHGRYWTGLVSQYSRRWAMGVARLWRSS